VTLTIELAAVLLLVLLNAFFVAAEYGLVTARRTRILELQHQGSRRARDVLKIVADPPRFIAAMQLGVTLTSLAIGALGEHALSKVLDPLMATLLAVILAFFVITFLHVVIGELVPKGIALGHSETTALAVSAPVRAFFTVFGPLIWILQRSTEFVLRAIGLDATGGESDVHSEAELRMLVSQSTEHGEIEEQEQEMLYKVFDFADKEASDVMVPRPEVVALSIDLPPEECLEAVMDSPFTRYPVYRGSLDEIVGVLHIRDLFLAQREDLLEEIVGEIEDEFDLPDESIEQVDDHTIRIDGTFPIDDFNEQFRTDLPGEDYHTMAGFVFGLLGRVPEPGDTVSHDGMRFDVVEVEGSRIDRLEVTFEQRRELRERDEAEPEAQEADPGAAA
jgi:putative hemolysin